MEIKNLKNWENDMNRCIRCAYCFEGCPVFKDLRWEPDEYNFFKERREKGTKDGFKARDKRYKGKAERLDK